MRAGGKVPNNVKIGLIDPDTGGKWIKNKEGRWMIKCCTIGEAKNNPGKMVECNKSWRPGAFVKNHICKYIDESVKDSQTQTNLNIYISKTKKPIVAAIALTGAKINISARSLASTTMIWLLNLIAETYYQKGKKGDALEIIQYTDKEITEEINFHAERLKEKNIQELKSFKYASAILDAGTVNGHHDLELMLTVPGMMEPFLYRTVNIKTGTIDEYKSIITNLSNELLSNDIVLSCVCGDNLAAQKNGIDHTNPNSIQFSAYDELLKKRKRRMDLSLTLKSYKENENDNIENIKRLNTEISEINRSMKIPTNISALVFNPCLNHTLNLAFQDIISECETIQIFITIVEKYNELFKEKSIMKKLGKNISFPICKTRWLYLFDSLLELYKKRKIINKFYQESKNNELISSILKDEKYEEIQTFPNNLVNVINLIWPLHTFSYYIEQNSTMLCDIIPAYNKVISQINSRGEKYDLQNESDLIIGKLETRFHETARWDLIVSAYMLSPYGRAQVSSNKFRTNEPFLPQEILFFEIEDLESEKEIEKYHKYIKASETIEEETYIYFEDDQCDNPNQELTDEEKLELKSDLQEILMDAKCVGIDLLSCYTELISYIQKSTHSDIDNRINGRDIELLEMIVQYFNSFIEILHKYDIDQYIFHEIVHELKEFQCMGDSSCEDLKDMMKKTKDHKIDEHSLNKFVSTATKAERNLDRMFETLDVLSDEFSMKLNLLYQDIDKERIWSCSLNASKVESTEENTVTLTLHQMAILLDYNEAKIEEAYSKYMGKDECIQEVTLAECLISLHPIKFWQRIKRCDPSMKELAAIALRILSIPVSEADCERIISKKRRIITKYHTRMSTKLIESRASIMLTKQSRIQELLQKK